MGNMKAGSSKEIRDFFAKPENAALNKANAFVVKTGLAKIVLNLFLQFSKPSYPTKSFRNEDATIEWLRTMR